MSHSFQEAGACPVPPGPQVGCDHSGVSRSKEDVGWGPRHEVWEPHQPHRVAHSPRHMHTPPCFLGTLGVWLAGWPTVWPPFDCLWSSSCHIEVLKTEHVKS